MFLRRVSLLLLVCLLLPVNHSLGANYPGKGQEPGQVGLRREHRTGRFCHRER